LITIPAMKDYVDASQIGRS